MLSDFFPEGIISGFDKHHKKTPNLWSSHLFNQVFFDVDRPEELGFQPQDQPYCSEIKQNMNKHNL